MAEVIDPASLSFYRRRAGQDSKLKLLEFLWRWTPDSHALAYIDPRSNYNISSLPIDGDPPKQLTNFDTDHIFRFAWSRDGKQLAMMRGNVTNDVVFVNNLR